MQHCHSLTLYSTKMMAISEVRNIQSILLFIWFINKNMFSHFSIKGKNVKRCLLESDWVRTRLKTSSPPLITAQTQNLGYVILNTDLQLIETFSQHFPKHSSNTL